MAFVEGQRAAEDDEHTEVGHHIISSFVVVTNLIRLMARMKNLARNRLLSPPKNSCEDLTRSLLDDLPVQRRMNAPILDGNTLFSVLVWAKTLILR